MPVEIRPDKRAMLATLHQPRVAVFCKAPTPGYAKTRLNPRLGAQGAARLHAELAMRTLTSAVDACIGVVELWCAPDVKDTFFRRCHSMHGVRLVQQPVGDLSVRLLHCFRRLLLKAPFVIVIGTDCPAINAAYLRDAANALLTGDEAVIGPALDGGYVLLGLRRCSSTLFERIPWSTVDVLQITRERLRTADYQWQELQPLLDIDTPEDLDRWQSES